MAFPIHKLPPHHFHLGENLFLVVNEFRGRTLTHLRRFKENPDTQLLHPTNDGMTIHSSVWTEFPDTVNQCCLAVSRGLLIAPISQDRLRLQSMTERDGSFHFTSAITIQDNQFYQIRPREVLYAIAEVQLGATLLQAIKLQLTQMNVMPAVEVSDLDAELGVATALWDLLKTHFDIAVCHLSKCSGCEEQQANQLGHECTTWTMNERFQSVKARVPALLDIPTIAKELCESYGPLLSKVSLDMLTGLCNCKMIIKNMSNLYAGDRDFGMFFK